VRDNEQTRSLALATAAALTLAACGGSSAGDGTHSQAQPAPKQSPPAAGGLHPASRANVAVIRAWSDTLRAGHPAKAATFFALPSVIQNAGPEVRLITRKDVVVFNRTLPCGAHLVKTIAGARYTVATFVLTERPGSPGCNGVGQLAATAFLFRHGKISEWRRVVVPPLGGDQPQPSPEPSGPGTPV
jgi:hypothetical protein